MARTQPQPDEFILRDLSPGETSIAFLGMAHVLKEVLVQVSSDQDLAALKASLIHKVKNATMSERAVRNEIAVLDTIIDLIEMAHKAAEQSLAHARPARPRTC